MLRICYLRVCAFEKKETCHSCSSNSRVCLSSRSFAENPFVKNFNISSCKYELCCRRVAPQGVVCCSCSGEECGRGSRRVCSVQCVMRM